MRKAIFTLFMASITLLGVAQIQPPVIELSGDIELDTREAQPRTAATVDVEDWYAWWQDWSTFEGGFNQTASYYVLYPDTDMVNLYLDPADNSTINRSNTWCSFGQGFDPQDQAWSDADLAGIRDWHSYTVDSGFVNVGYFRTNPDESIVDTLIVQIFVNTDNQLVTGFYQTGPSSFAIPKQDRRRGAVGANYTYELKIPLDATDSSNLSATGTFRPKRVAWGWNGSEGLTLSPNQVVHTTVSFKPGQDYTLGDTLYFDPDLAGFGVQPPTKVYNRFGVLVSVQTPNVSPLKSYNNGSYIARWNRYKDPEGTPAFMAGTYNPGRYASGGNSAQAYPNIAFKVKANYDSGIDNLDADGYGISSVYPNPTAGNASLKFSVGNNENVNIAVYDVAGKKVMDLANGSYAKGEHTINFNTANLDAGIYVYTITAGGYTESARFSVAK